MGCTGCTVNGENGSPKGCRNNGGCSTGGCNRLNTYDWLSSMDIVDTDPFDMVEVSFKNGARKDFYRVPDYYHPATGDRVVVDTGNGYDVGRVVLSGELVRLQMRKKKVSRRHVRYGVVRKANKRDLDRLQEARELERPTMIRARAIARSLDLDMKIGDVEYQGDRRKATFYYTADGRVDFRELIRHYAREFRIKIEMRQIGARQESARIGGLGSCGRELCCSTWLTDFKSVSTAAARYQNLAINQAKLSGQCGRLKCCLNYELDTYIEALEQFPDQANRIETAAGTAVLIKTDIFKRILYYAYTGSSDAGRGKIYPIALAKVREMLAMIEAGEKPADLVSSQISFGNDSDEVDFEEDLTGVIELPDETRKKKRRKKRKKGDKHSGNHADRKSNNKRRRGRNNKKEDKGR